MPLLPVPIPCCQGGYKGSWWAQGRALLPVGCWWIEVCGPQALLKGAVAAVGAPMWGALGSRGHTELPGSHVSVLSRNARAGERNLHISSMYIIFRRGRGESLGPLITFILLPLDCWLCM